MKIISEIQGYLNQCNKIHEAHRMGLCTEEERDRLLEGAAERAEGACSYRLEDIEEVMFA